MIEENLRSLGSILQWWFICFAINNIGLNFWLLLVFKKSSGAIKKYTKRVILTIIFISSCLYGASLVCNLQEDKSTIGLSIITFLFYMVFIMVFINLKQMSRVYLVIFIKFFVLIFSMNLLMISTYDYPNFMMNTYSGYYFTIFSNQASNSSMILCFLYSIIFFSEKKENMILVEMTSVKIENDDDVCSNCLDKLNSEKEVIKTRCDHVYHKDCLLVSINNSNSCPLCRRRIDYYNLC
jgi:hypothetical protein